MKQVKKFADSGVGLAVIIAGAILLFIPDPIPFVDEIITLVLAYQRFVE